MSLDSAFFVSATIHSRPVELPDGSKYDLHFKEIPAVEFAKYRLDQSSEDADTKVGAVAKLICASLCEADGKPALSYAKALQLKAGAMNALLAAVIDVNSAGNVGNASAPGEATGSGTSSPSRSEDEPSTSGNA